MLTKSMIITSATGRRPDAAAPTAAPTIAASEIGVSLTRSAPWVVERPFVTCEMPPPGSAMSSPTSTTSGSVASARSSALLSASRMLIVVTSPSVAPLSVPPPPSDPALDPSPYTSTFAASPLGRSAASASVNATSTSSRAWRSISSAIASLSTPSARSALR